MPFIFQLREVKKLAKQDVDNQEQQFANLKETMVERGENGYENLREKPNQIRLLEGPGSSFMESVTQAMKVLSIYSMSFLILAWGYKNK